jgi:hypothetical protein
MPVLTLAERLYGAHLEEGRQALLSILRDILRGLDIHLRFLGITKTGWAMVEIEGPDSEVAEVLLRRIVGTVPRRVSELKEGMEFRGRIAKLREGYGIFLNVGIEEPEIFQAFLSLQSLLRQLGDGRRLGIRELANLFCLHEGIPLEVRILSSKIGTSARIFEVELTDRQLKSLYAWKSLSLDRVFVIGATTRRVRRAIKASRCERYILRVERLGVLENVLVCKIGTEAPGILHTISTAIPDARLYVLQGGSNQKRYRIIT